MSAETATAAAQRPARERIAAVVRDIEPGERVGLGTIVERADTEHDAVFRWLARRVDEGDIEQIAPCEFRRVTLASFGGDAGR